MPRLHLRRSCATETTRLDDSVLERAHEPGRACCNEIAKGFSPFVAMYISGKAEGRFPYPRNTVPRKQIPSDPLQERHSAPLWLKPGEYETDSTGSPAESRHS